VLKNVILYFINLYLYLKEFILNYTLLLEQLYDHIKQSQHLPLSLMLMTRTINTASTGLTVSMKAIDKAKDETTVHIKAVEGEHTKKINNIEEIKEQDFRRRDTMSATN
jgi:uncharacterized protein YchJ